MVQSTATYNSCPVQLSATSLVLPQCYNCCHAQSSDSTLVQSSSVLLLLPSPVLPYTVLLLLPSPFQCIWPVLWMGWDKLSGTGVTTAQKFVQRPTPFLTRHSASRLGVGNPNEQTPPQSRANRRIHTDRSDPITNTIFLKSPGVPAPAQQKPGAWENQGRHESFTVSGCLV